jgi:hypothetical protein
MDLNEFQPAARTKVLLYGPPKSGKTKLAGDLAEAGFTLDWFDLESGIKTLVGESGLSKEARGRINYFRIPDHKMYPIAIDTMKAVFRTASPKKICSEHGVINCPICAKDSAAKYSTLDFSLYDEKRILVIDSLTQLAMSALFKKILPQIKGDKGDEYRVEWEDYAAQSNALTEVLSKLQVLPINCIVISHEVDAEKDEKKESIVPQAGTRNYSKLIAKYFDDVAYAYRVNGKHKVASSTSYSNTVLTGSRNRVEPLNAKGEPSLVPLFTGVAEFKPTPTTASK